MTGDLESRVKAIEDQLIPDPDKMSTMKASNRLKQYLDDHKIGNESQQDVMCRLIHENAELRTELELCRLECEGLKVSIAGKELKKHTEGNKV